MCGTEHRSGASLWSSRLYSLKSCSWKEKNASVKFSVAPVGARIAAGNAGRCVMISSWLRQIISPGDRRAIILLLFCERRAQTPLIEFKICIFQSEALREKKGRGESTEWISSLVSDCPLFLRSLHLHMLHCFVCFSLYSFHQCLRRPQSACIRAAGGMRRR